MKKMASGEALETIRGVQGVSNRITIEPKASTTVVKDKIEAPFRRSAELDARRISVDDLRILDTPDAEL